MSELVDDYDLLSVEVGNRADRVATVAIERPDARNALNGQVRTELKDAVAAADAADDVRVLVLTGGDGSGAFVAGADVTEFRDRGVVEQREASQRPRVYETVDDASIPVLARINGHALGGGCELAQACDVRIAAAGSKLGQPEINLGIIPGGGGTQRLTRLVGEGQAMRLILSGELIDAEEAREIGLVDEVLEADELDERVYELAEKMATKSPIALEFAKNAVKASSRTGLEEGLDYEAELFVQLFATDDKDEGIDAFLEGREPSFTGE
ncbi:enoyl-CoA hydratase-related protein [Halostagnicola sp. A-GB9-2]|uniref:enoyl-CoA hydratase/isomerase family protein n=1 Tax=Halostagnicola sp. A-GB9-2 TaxID=3048066 RepID=UPI0024C00C0F|nr:enoyl-CoA hydratase-related protein [Halostagnicola sp. A-GB9-2]MDJ1433303.1 enoyl-CoA hydratase-related protein [Halostagnicola sp. A-GB9-2]